MQKSLWSFLSLRLRWLPLIGVLTYSYGRQALYAAVTSDINSITIEKEAALNNWVEDSQLNLGIIVTSPRLREALGDLQHTSRESDMFMQAHDQIVDELLRWTGTEGFSESGILAPDTGEIMVSTSPADEGKYRESQPFFINGKKGPFVQNVYYSTALKSATMTVSTPVRYQSGKLIGVLSGNLDMTEINTIITRRTGIKPRTMPSWSTHRTCLLPNPGCFSTPRY